MNELNIENFPERAGVRITGEFLRALKKRIKKKSGSLTAFCLRMAQPEFTPTSMRNLLKEGTTRRELFPLSMLLRCCKECAVSLGTLQKNIIAYGLRRGSLLVRNPAFPVRIDPVFDMLFAHHIGDGFVLDAKRNRHPYFGYKQFDLLYRLLYYEKLQWISGDIDLLLGASPQPCGADPRCGSGKDSFSSVFGVVSLLVSDVFFGFLKGYVSH